LQAYSLFLQAFAPDRISAVVKQAKLVPEKATEQVDQIRTQLLQSSLFKERNFFSFKIPARVVPLKSRKKGRLTPFLRFFFAFSCSFEGKMS